MKVSEQQVSLLIKRYMRNNRDRLKNISLYPGTQVIDDDVHISDEGKKILLERLNKQIMERARKELSPGV